MDDCNASNWNAEAKVSSPPKTMTSVYFKFIYLKGAEHINLANKQSLKYPPTNSEFADAIKQAYINLLQKPQNKIKRNSRDPGLPVFTTYPTN